MNILYRILIFTLMIAFNISAKPNCDVNNSMGKMFSTPFEESSKQNVPIEVFSQTHEATNLQSVFSPDGKYFVCPGKKCLNIWDWKARNLISSLDISQANYVAFSKNGRYLAACERYFHKVLKIWDFPKRREILSCEGYGTLGIHGNLVKTDFRYLLFTPDNDYLLSLEATGFINFWDLNRLNRVFIIDTQCYLYDINISSDGKWIAAVGENSEENICLFLWDYNSKKLIHKIKLGTDGVTFGLAFTNDSKSVTCSAANVIITFDTENGKEIKRSDKLNGSIRHIVYSSNGKYLVCIEDITLLNKDWENWSGRWEVDIVIFDTESLKCIKRYHNQAEPSKELNSNGRYLHLAFSPDGKYMAVSCEDRTMIWKTPKILYEK
ncbi:WD40 repeat domain-containing protein [Planctomycetota bacterium]